MPFDPFWAVKNAFTVQGSTYAAPKDYCRAVKLGEAYHDKFLLDKCITLHFRLDNTEPGLETVMNGRY